MKIFTCANCGQLLHFENSTCLRCGAPLGFRPDELRLMTLAALDDGRYAMLGGPPDAWVFCANAGAGGCNWLVPAGGDAYCPACGLNRTIPDLDLPENQERWRAIESAKRRLIYALRRFGLPLTSMHDDEAHGLAFDFLSDAAGGKPVMTGHADGLVTINVAEADSAERERRRVDLGEPYRTLLGHLRHEVGHYYWDLLVCEGGRLDAARAAFGDERADYGEALQRHYRNGPPPDWQSAHVSSYATMHPWEDFAETWTHYFHMVDTLDTAANFGVVIDPRVTRDPHSAVEVAFDPYRAPSCQRLVEEWLPLTVALNSLNRSMGQPDLYPFVLSPPAIEKLGFVHDLVRGAR